MSDRDKTATLAELIDEQVVFSVADLCRSCAVEAEFIEAMIEEGILEPSGTSGRHVAFHASSLRRTRITVRLHRDLGVNLAGAGVALDLLERIEALEARLRANSERPRP